MIYKTEKKNQILQGKTVVFFISLPHHLKRLNKVISVFEKNGAKVKFLTTYNFVNRDDYTYSFEDYLIKEGKDYDNLYDFLDHSVLDKIKQNRLHNYPQLITQLNQLGTMFSFLNEDSSFQAVDQAIENYCLFEKYLQIIKPDIFCALHEGNFWGKMFFYLAKQSNILNISFQEGLWYDQDPFWDKVYKHMADYSQLFVWGKYSKDLAHKVKANISNFHVIGNVEYDDLIKNGYQPVLDIKKELKISNNEYLVGFFPAHYRDIYFCNINDMIRFLYNNFFKHNPSYKLVVKLHPQDNCYKIDSHLLDMNNIFFVQDINSLDIITGCNAVIPVDSTVGLETLILNKPLFELNYQNFPYRHSYAKYGGAIELKSKKDFYLLKKTCEDGSFANKKGKQYLNYMINNSLNSGATEKFKNFLISHLKKVSQKI